MADKSCLDSSSFKANSWGFSKVTSFMPTCQWQGVMMTSFPNDGLAPKSCGADSCGMRKALTPSGAVLNFETHAIRLSNFCKLGKYNASIAWFIATRKASESGAA